MDGVDLVATVETVKVDIGDAIWAMLVPKKVLHLENSLPRSVADSVEAVGLLLLRRLVALEML